MYSPIKNPYEHAENKKYFVNLFSGNVKIEKFYEGIKMFPKISAIAEKLSEDELKYLIEQIDLIR